MATKIKYKDILTEHEYKILDLEGAAQLNFLRKGRPNTSIKTLLIELTTIQNKVIAYEASEQRQIKRAEKINQAYIEAAVKGSNELLIMSEV